MPKNPAEATTAPGLRRDQDAPGYLSFRRVAGIGFLVIAVFFGGFGLWAGFAPLSSAAVAPAELIVSGQRKTVRHLEGGIVGEIMVEEGQPVEAGEVLLRLDPTRARAQVERLRLQHRAAVARLARLEASRDGKARVDYPEWLSAEALVEPKVTELIAAQERILVARRISLHGEQAIRRERVAQLEEEILGLEGEEVALAEQRRLLEDEIDGIAQLYERQLVEKPRLRALERERARLDGDLIRARSGIAQAGAAIAETELEIGELTNRMLNEDLAELRDTQSEVFDLAEQLIEAQDALRRTEVVAPVAGIVVNRRVHTSGSSIEAGEELLDLVPAEEGLVIEARIDPNDVDNLHPGLETRVRISALPSRHVPTLPGTLRVLSADSLKDERSGQTYFLGLVELDAEAVRGLGDVALRPGMHAEVTILTGERTFFDYLLEPLMRSFERSFTEA